MKIKLDGIELKKVLTDGIEALDKDHLIIRCWHDERLDNINDISKLHRYELNVTYPADDFELAILEINVKSPFEVIIYD